MSPLDVARFSESLWENETLTHLREEKRKRVAIKVWWRDLQSCWECSGTCYTHIQCQATTIVAPTWWHTTTWCCEVLRKSMGKRNFDPPEGRKTPTPGSKSMVEGPTKVLRVFRALLYTYTMPNHHYTSTYMLAYHHLKPRRSPKACGKTKLWPTWGKKNANAWQ